MSRRRAPRRPQFIVRTTESAHRAAARLRGDERDSFERAVADLAAVGCRQGGYRLLGDDGGWSRYCCRRGYGELRFVLTFVPSGGDGGDFDHLADDERDVVIIVALGHHDDSRFYSELSKQLGVAAVGQRREDKPACCGERGWPSVGEL